MRQQRYDIPKTTIWSAASLLVDRHGTRAADVAQRVLDQSRLHDDEARAWKSVMLAVREIIHLRRGGELRVVH